MACILIVDDEKMVRSALAIALTNAGYTVLEAKSGHEAVSILASKPVSLILADVIMPNGDGIELMMNLRKTKNPTPVIAMTGGHENTDLFLRITKRLGARRVLQKPFSHSALLERVSEALAEEPVDKTSRG